MSTGATQRPLGALLTCLVCLGLALWQTPRPAPADFAPPRPETLAEPRPALPFLRSEMLPSAAPSAHAVSLAQLPAGPVVAAWFAGSREGADDVAIYLSRRDLGGWTPPRIVAGRQETTQATRRHVRKLGNPVLYVDGAGILHLYYVSVSIGGWAGSSINHKHSRDGGETWSPAEKLVTSPFFNISTLVRTPPLPLQDGGLGLPAYHEFLAKQGEWLRLDSNGKILDKVRLPQPRPALQPAVVALDGQRALALMRDAGSGQGRILSAFSPDGGNQWQAAPDLPLGNPNASVALIRLSDGRLLLADNPETGRNILLLHISADQGQTWRALPPVETNLDKNDKTIEFSYPCLLEDRAGNIHLAYTWHRQGIRHVVFNRAWLDQAGEPRP